MISCMVPLMLDRDDLRKKAAQYRRAAGIRTTGGQAADRRLIELALRLERQADQMDRANAAQGEKPRGGA